MTSLGYNFKVVTAGTDETLPEGTPPEVGVKILAVRKGAAVVPLVGADDHVLSSDTLVELDGVPLGKPKDAEDAKRMLRSLSGRTHFVRTGVALCHRGRVYADVASAAVTFYPLSEEQISAYVAGGEPMDKAGAYGIQGQGGEFVEKLDGDFDTVKGLSGALVGDLFDRCNATELACDVVATLEKRYPEARCALEYGGDPWRLLVMARLSAQCTDARVNIVCKELFEKYPTPRKMAEADLAELEELVRPCGLYRMKAESIREASRMLIDRFGGKIPDTMEKLLTLPGVGRKIANLLLGDVFGYPAVVCDTHFMRICGRIGFYPEDLRDPERIEGIMRPLLPPESSSDFCHRVVMFGRQICTARAPSCDVCPLSGLCRHAKEKKNG